MQSRTTGMTPRWALSAAVLLLAGGAYTLTDFHDRKTNSDALSRDLGKAGQANTERPGDSQITSRISGTADGRLGPKAKGAGGERPNGTADAGAMTGHGFREKPITSPFPIPAPQQRQQPTGDAPYRVPDADEAFALPTVGDPPLDPDFEDIVRHYAEIARERVARETDISSPDPYVVARIMEQTAQEIAAALEDTAFAEQAGANRSNDPMDDADRFEASDALAVDGTPANRSDILYRPSYTPPSPDAYQQWRGSVSDATKAKVESILRYYGEQADQRIARETNPTNPDFLTVVEIMEETNASIATALEAALTKEELRGVRWIPASGAAGNLPPD